MKKAGRIEAAKSGDCGVILSAVEGSKSPVGREKRNVQMCEYENVRIQGTSE